MFEMCSQYSLLLERCCHYAINATLCKRVIRPGECAAKRELGCSGVHEHRPRLEVQQTRRLRSSKNICYFACCGRTLFSDPPQPGSIRIVNDIPTLADNIMRTSGGVCLQVLAFEDHSEHKMDLDAARPFQDYACHLL